MGSNFFKNFILDEEQREETFNIVDFSLPNSDDFYPLLTCDQYDDIEAYYIFNRIKVWQKNLNNDNKAFKDNALSLLLIVLLFLAILLGILHGINELKNKKSSSSSYKQQVVELKKISIKEKIITLIRVCM